MSDQEHPVTVAVQRADGSIEQVRVGTAVQQGDGFVLRMGDLRIGPAEAAAPRASSGWTSGATSPGGLPTNLPNYGRTKGAPIQGASMQDLEYYAAGSRRTLADPAKSRWHEKEKLMLAALEAEIARQGGQPAPAPSAGPSAPPSEGSEPPPPSDEDIPF